MSHKDKVTYFAETDFRNKKTKFGIRADDRSRHMYVIGKTGMGKSTMLENMAIQDIQSGEGITFIDPHGSTAEKLLKYVPEHRIKDVVYFAPFDTEYPISFNVLENTDPSKSHLIVNGLMSTFKKIWVDAFSGRMEYILTMTLLALLEYPEATLLGVNRMYTDKEFRKKVVDNISDPSVKAFWVEEYAKYEPKFATEATAAIQNKIGQFTANPLIRNMLGQLKSSFDFRKIIDERKIFIVNLSLGKVGEGNANLIGSMLITKLYVAALSRADLEPGELESLPPHYFYVDEFQNFANESFAGILSQARKYKLALTVAHQYVEQMTDEVRAAVFGNVGSMVVFRVGAVDAEIFEKEFAPFFILDDIVSLGFGQIYLRLMIHGVGSQPFSATTLPPIEAPEVSYERQVIEYCRTTYARKKEEVERDVRAWLMPSAPVAGNSGHLDIKKNESKKEYSKTEQNTPPKSLAPTQPPVLQQHKSTQSPLRESGIKVSNHSIQSTRTGSLKDVLQKELASQKAQEVSKPTVVASTGERISLSKLLSKEKGAQKNVEHAKQKANLRQAIGEHSDTVNTFPQKKHSMQTDFSVTEKNKNQTTSTEKKEEYKDVSSQKTDISRVAKKQTDEIPPDVLKKLLE